MKTRTGKFQHADKMQWETVAPGLSRQIMGYDGQLMMVKVKFETGAIAATHDHYHSQVTYVASGKFKVTIDGESAMLKEGDSFYMEPDSVHGAECLEEGILIDTFSPHRADFLKK